MGSFSFANMPSSAALFSTYTQFTAYFMLAKSVLDQAISIIDQYTPEKLRDYIHAKFESFFARNHIDYLTLIIKETEGMYDNQIYNAAEFYLRTIISPSVDRLKVSKVLKQKSIAVDVEDGEEIIDNFEGIELIWELVYKKYKDKESSPYSSRPNQWFELSFEKRYKEKVLASYLPYVLDKAKVIKEQNRIPRLHCPDDDSIDLEHPSTFDTMAMDPEDKKALMDDLDMFLTRRDFYKRVGKAWKRGYLLYGPPGTGKSSLIAAMANYLKFDIYDIDLGSICSDSDLRKLLVSTKNKSMIVIEDIDCGGKFQNRDDSSDSDDDDDDDNVTLSGLLNFIDGLWSSCGEERVIVFTTNYKDRLDPALLRPGRMDVHIEMGYCTYAAFKVLANNYLSIQDHPLFEQIQSLIAKVEVTPAEVAEKLLRTNKVDTALEGLIEFLLEKKIKKDEEIKTGAEKGEENKKDAKIKNDEEKDEETENDEEKDEKINKDEEKDKKIKNNVLQQLQGLIEEVEVSPAEVAEQLKGLVEFLLQKKIEKDEEMNEDTENDVKKDKEVKKDVEKAEEKEEEDDVKKKKKEEDG